MKRIYSHINLSLLAMVLLTASCTQEELTRPEQTANGGIVLKLSLANTKITRATETGDDNLNENRVNTLDIFIYKENEARCVFYQRKQPEKDLVQETEYKVLLEASQEMFALKNNYDTYVIANYAGEIPPSGLSLAELKQLATPELDPDRKQESFIMDGMARMILNDGVIIDKEIAISLKRAVAKIRLIPVYTNGYAASLQKEASKKLVHYAPTGNLLEQGEETGSTLQDMVSFTPLTSGAGNSDQSILYSYPNDWSQETYNETYLLINVPVNTPDGTEILQNYYKIPIGYRFPGADANSSSGENSLLYKLQRNYLYDITVQIDKPGADTPETAVELKGNYIIQDWSTKEVLVAVEGFHFIYVKDTKITLPNNTRFTTTFQSSTPNVEITDIQVNGMPIENGTNGVSITATPEVKSGEIVINTSLPTNFVAKEVTFSVRNEAKLSQQVSVSQYPALYIGSHISADTPGGSQGQNNNKMYIVSSFVADFSTLPDPDEFDEDFGSGYTHYAPQQELGASYAQYIRDNGILGYPQTDSNGATIDTDENNRRISPRFMLASQHGVTSADNYGASRTKCQVYAENDKDTGLLYEDWRMPTLAELYMIDVLQNIQACEVKEILEGGWYWSSRASAAVNFVDPRVGNGGDFNSLYTSVRCVRDVK